MKFRFSVICFAPSHARVAISGSLSSLGSWEVPIPMSPMQIPQDEYHPSMWTVVIDIPDVVVTGKSNFQYKFIRWSSTPLEQMDQLVHSHNELEFQQPVHVCNDNKFPENPVWEGYGGSQNRVFQFGGHSNSITHVYNPEVNVTPDGIYSLPVQLFREPLISISEEGHTHRYYLRLKKHGEIHFNQILDRIYVGTCPRSKNHIKQLKEQTKISDFMNLQTVEDITENYPDPDGIPRREERTIQSIYDLFDSLNLRYIWIPTTDMCSAARARTVAQASFLLAGLLQRPDCTGIYVHCNAGVGRSIACIAGYLHCCLNVPIRLTNLIVNARRPVAYFDESALIRGAEDFRAKFQAASNLLKLPRLALVEEVNVKHETKKQSMNTN